MDFTQLGQLGVAGLAVFLMYKISANHINSNTEVLNQLKDAIVNLQQFLNNGRKKR